MKTARSVNLFLVSSEGRRAPRGGAWFRPFLLPSLFKIAGVAAFRKKLSQAPPTNYPVATATESTAGTISHRRGVDLAETVAVAESKSSPRVFAFLPLRITHEPIETRVFPWRRSGAELLPQSNLQTVANSPPVNDQERGRRHPEASCKKRKRSRVR